MLLILLCNRVRIGVVTPTLQYQYTEFISRKHGQPRHLCFQSELMLELYFYFADILKEKWHWFNFFCSRYSVVQMLAASVRYSVLPVKALNRWLCAYNYLYVLRMVTQNSIVYKCVNLHFFMMNEPLVLKSLAKFCLTFLLWGNTLFQFSQLHYV